MYSFDEKCKLYLAENFRDSKARYIVPSCGGVYLRALRFNASNQKFVDQKNKAYKQPYSGVFHFSTKNYEKTSKICFKHVFLHPLK